MPAKTAVEKPGLFESVESIAKVTTGVFGLLYVVGFLISNIQLMALGIADFSALQARNVMIGFLFFGYLLLAACIVYPVAAIPAAIQRASAAAPQRNKLAVYAEAILRQFFILLVTLLAVAELIGLFLPWGLSYWELWRLWLFPSATTAIEIGSGLLRQLTDAFFHTSILFSALGILAAEFFVIDFLTVKKYRWKNEGPATLILGAVMTTIFFAFFLYGYANDVYPNLKYNLGGGQPQIANLTLTGKKPEMAGLQSAGLTMHRLCCDSSEAQPQPRNADAEDATAVPDIAIWYQSDKFLYIAGARGQMKSRVIAVDLKLVRSIHYLPNFVRVESGGRIVSWHSH